MNNDKRLGPDREKLFDELNDERRREFPKIAEQARTQLVDGRPVPEDQSHTELKANGQQQDYVILAPEERAKGYVRPVRRGYVHVGPPAPANLRELTAEEKTDHAAFGYIKYETYGPERHPVVGRYWTQADMDRLGKGCGTVTTMSPSIAETYARDPQFYSGTFCVRCGKHFPVGRQGEFVWGGTDERVGT